MRKKITNFKFPSEVPSSIDGVNSLKHFLSHEIVREGMEEFCDYKFYTSQKAYIYAKCRYCISKISYKKNNSDDYILKNFDDSHEHGTTSNKQFILEQIEKLPDCFSLKICKNLIRKRFGISQSTFYRYYHEVKSIQPNFQDLQKKLQSENFIGYEYREVEANPQSLPDILIISSNEMIANFMKYGRLTGFDVTYNLVREKSSSDRQYGVGTFASTDENLSIVPFAVVFLAKETKAYLVRAFRNFFRMMSVAPDAIVSDEQLTIRLALEQLRESGEWKGSHFLDTFHLLRGIKGKLKEKEKISLFHKLMFAENKLAFQSILERENEFVDEQDAQILEKFLSHANKYCFSQIPTVLYGLSISTSFIEKLNDLIKQQIPRSAHYCRVALKIARFFQSSIRKRKITYQNKAFEKYFGLKELGGLRSLMSKKIFEKLINNLTRSISCMLNFSSEDTYDIQDEDQLVFQVRKISNKWQCSCQWGDKTGLPCPHIIKVLVVFKEPLLLQIHEMWLLKDYQISRNIQKKLNAPRSTRRRKK